MYRLTKSALLLGVLGFAGQIPPFVLAPLAGVLVDRRDRYRVLMATQVLAMIQSGLLAALALSHRITILAGGVVCIAAAAVFLRALPRLRRDARPTYVRMGILPDVE